jgi:hypothetical protein
MRAGAAAAAALWAALMLAWAGGLALGAWQAWPVFAGPAPPQDRVAAAMWLILGAAAWLLALDLGRRRFLRRRPDEGGRRAAASAALSPGRRPR